MAFGKYKEELEKHGNTGLYVQFKEGESIKLVILGEEVTGPAIFVEGQGYKKSSYDDGGRLRFAVPVWTGKEVKVLDGPETLYKAIGQLSEDVDDLERTLIAVKKVSNKKWEARAIKPLTAEQLEKIALLELPDVSKAVAWYGGAKKGKPAPVKDDDNDAFGDDSPAASSEPGPVSDDDIPF